MQRMLYLTFFSLMVTLTAAGCGENGSDEDEISSLNTFPEGISVETLFSSSEFKGPEVCGGCHSEIFDQWQGSMHNYSFTDPVYQALHRQAGEDTGGATDVFCSACHNPIGVFSGEVPPLDNPEISETSRQGVQCDFCHTVSSSTGIGNYSFVFAPSNIKRGPFNDAVSSYHETEYSDLHTRSEFCGMCHDVNHPGNDVPLEATYTEWKESPYAEQGIQCQDCHMTPGPGVTKPNPGRAAPDAKERPQIYTHYFVGGNAVLGDEQHNGLAVEQLKAAASIAIVAPETMPAGETSEVRIDVTNKGAGHYLPTGLTEVREMWLDVQVTDAGGKTVFHSGAVDEDGAVDADAVMYHTVLKDKNGDPTHKPWFAAGILSDHRIPPMETVSETYAIHVPDDAVAPLTVKATLRYRSAPQTVIEELLGDGAPTLPIIEMVTASWTCPG
ncbi:MAG: cytochrome c family protein [Gaiellales bacterium]|nr:MAG: cytochrome c family protein [Gaiellales bacterium]